MADAVQAGLVAASAIQGNPGGLIDQACRDPSHRIFDSAANQSISAIFVWDRSGSVAVRHATGATMDKLTQGLEQLAKATMIFAAFCAFGLAFLILIDVSARLFRISFYGVAEYVRNMIIVIVFLQLPYAIRIASMLRVDIFVNALPKSLSTPLYVLGNLLGVLFFAGITAGALPPAIDAWVNNRVEGEGVVDVAAWPARFAVVYGCGFAALLYFLRIIDTLLGREAAKPAEELSQF